MRQTSGATATGRKQGSGSRKQRPDPKSLAGRLLEAMASGQQIAGSNFPGGEGGKAGFAIEYLRSAYGFEIEAKKGPKGGYRLIGEWDGPYFVPIERMSFEP